MVLTPSLLVALTVAAPASSAEEARFDAMSGAHLAQFRDLALIRGYTLLEHRALPLAGLKALLAGAFGPDAAVLVYAHRTDPPVLDAWLVGADGIRASASTPIREDDLARAITDLQAAVGAGARAPRRRGGDVISHATRRGSPAIALDRLRGLLLPPPIAKKLGSVRELLVAPTLGLGAVPFAALEVDGEPLIQRRTVTVLPNLFGLGAVDAAARPGPLRPAVVVGDPDLTGDPDWVFLPLEGARAEAAFVAQKTGATPLLGSQATRGAVLEALDPSRGPQLLYFATHGVALPDDPLEGFLALAGPGGVDRWTARQIQDLRVPARLAVLSACQTGLGQGHGGGVVGVARAFQLAGVRNVVMSLWNVPDRPTEALMRGFLDAATRAPPAEPARALQEAMLKARKSDPGSLDWAAFALFATPPGRREAGIAQGGARLALEDADGKVTRDGGRVPVKRRLRLRVEGDRDAPRLHRYLLDVDADGRARLVEPPSDLVIELAPPLGVETLLLVEADRPLGLDAGGAEHAIDRGAGAPPRTLAGLAALFPLEDPALRLRILQLQVELVPDAPAQPR